MFARRSSLLLLLTILAATPAMAQDETWKWSKALAAGKAIEIKGINGDVSATPATGNEVEVIAKKSGDRNDPAEVKIEVVEHADGVTICAMYPQRGNQCLPRALGRSENRNNDVEVDFEVRVPRGVRFTGRTVNGSVRATGMTADVDASTVNGSVRVSTTGLAQASSVNGSLTVCMGRTNWNNALEFKTVNGGRSEERRVGKEGRSRW